MKCTTSLFIISMDKNSVEYQRLTWDALSKKINDLVNKVTATNIKNTAQELLSENLYWGDGLFCRACMAYQMASPASTDVFAALVAAVNTKFPEVTELLLKRIVWKFKIAYKWNVKPVLITNVKFVAHLLNQKVVDEIIALEMLDVLLKKPTDDSVQVAVYFVIECGSALRKRSPKALRGVFKRFKEILHEGEVDKSVKFWIELLFSIRKTKFQGYPAIRPELDLVKNPEETSYFHQVSLDKPMDPEFSRDTFKYDPNYLEKYEEFTDDEEGSDADVHSEVGENELDDESGEESMQIKDETESNRVNLQRTNYSTVMSSLGVKEAGHKLVKIHHLEPGEVSDSESTTESDCERQRKRRRE